MTRTLERLGDHDVRRFRCGVHALDDYLCRHARGNAELGVGATWLLGRAGDDPADWPEIIGYFTLSMAQLPAEVIRRIRTDKLPGYPLPVALIGRLARDRRVRGGAVGEQLLGEAIRKIVEASRLVACFGIVADAKDDLAVAFYERYGFQVLEAGGPPPRRCFLSLQTATLALADSPPR